MDRPPTTCTRTWTYPITDEPSNRPPAPRVPTEWGNWWWLPIAAIAICVWANGTLP